MITRAEKVDAWRERSELWTKVFDQGLDAHPKVLEARRLDKALVDHLEILKDVEELDQLASVRRLLREALGN